MAAAAAFVCSCTTLWHTKAVAAATALQINARSTAFALFGSSHCTNFAHHFIERYELAALNLVEAGFDLRLLFRRELIINLIAIDHDSAYLGRVFREHSR